MTTNDWTPEAKMDRVITKLMKAAMDFGNRINPTNQPLSLAEHPFRLKMPEEYFTSMPGQLILHYMDMTCFLGRIAKEISQEWRLLHLRVIKAKFAPEEDDRHYVYYEVIFNGHALLYEGATDCSGAGGMMNNELQGLFQILSTIYGVGVETVTVSYGARMIARDIVSEANRRDYLSR